MGLFKIMCTWTSLHMYLGNFYVCECVHFLLSIYLGLLILGYKVCIFSALFWTWKWKCFSRVWLFVTPWTIESVEFSRPEYWSGWLFSSPKDLPKPGIKPRSPTLQVDSLPVEPQGKPKSTGAGSLYLLQWIFLTQEPNRGLLHWKQILYHKE